MHNISSIFRFNTPFIDIASEKNGLLSVMKRIEKSLEFDWINFEKTTTKDWEYFKISLIFVNNIWKIDFFYVSNLSTHVYHLPIFKLNIFLNEHFLLNNDSKTKTIKFLNNIFECFDWLNEKEYLIDLDNNLYYTSWFFKTKYYPNHDFSNLDIIKNDFESKNWMQLLENFIIKFQNKKYVLTKENSSGYHKLHWILLYFIYLVFIMSQNLEKTEKIQKTIEKSEWNWIYEWHISLIKERLNYVDNLNKETFDKYKNRLELFFKMF